MFIERFGALSGGSQLPGSQESGLYTYGVEASGQGSGPVSSSGTVLGACIGLSACFMSVLLPT